MVFGHQANRPSQNSLPSQITTFLLERWETVSAWPCLTTRTSLFFTQQESTSPNPSFLFCPGKPAASCLLRLHKMDFKHLVECFSSCYQCLPSSSNFLDGLFFIHSQLSFLTLHSNASEHSTYNRQGTITSYCVHQRLSSNTTWDCREYFRNFPIPLVHITALNVPKPSHELFLSFPSYSLHILNRFS